MPTNIQAPSIAYGPLAPLLIVFAAATVGVLVEAFVPAARRRTAQVVVAALGLLGALVAVVVLAGTSRLVVEGAVAVDGPALFLQGTLCVLGLGGILLLSERSLDSSGGEVVSQAASLPARAMTCGWPSTRASRPRSTRSPCSPSVACCCSRPPTTCC